MMQAIIREMRRDNNATARRITEHYHLLSELYHDGTNNWFTFAYWAARKVSDVIHETDEFMPQVSNALTGGMQKMFDHVMSDCPAVARSLEGTVEREQELLQPWLYAAFWSLDPLYVTSEMICVEFPEETLWASQRVPGTEGDIGAPVTNWLDYDQRTPWMLGVIRTHLHDGSLRGGADA